MRWFVNQFGIRLILSCAIGACWAGALPIGSSEDDHVPVNLVTMAVVNIFGDILHLGDKLILGIIAYISSVNFPLFQRQSNRIVPKPHEPLASQFFG